jgi:hypothetical protein
LSCRWAQGLAPRSSVSRLGRNLRPDKTIHMKNGGKCTNWSTVRIDCGSGCSRCISDSHTWPSQIQWAQTWDRRSALSTGAGLASVLGLRKTNNSRNCHCRIHCSDLLSSNRPIYDCLSSCIASLTLRSSTSRPGSSPPERRWPIILSHFGSLSIRHLYGCASETCAAPFHGRGRDC